MSKPDKPIFNQQGGRGKLYGSTRGATYMGTYQMPDGKMDRRMFNCATNKDAIPDDSDRSTVFKRRIWICGYGSHDGSAGTFYHPDCNLLSVLPKTYYRRCRGRSCEGIRLVRKKGMD